MYFESRKHATLLFILLAGFSSDSVWAADTTATSTTTTTSSAPAGLPNSAATTTASSEPAPAAAPGSTPAKYPKKHKHHHHHVYHTDYSTAPVAMNTTMAGTTGHTHPTFNYQNYIPDWFSNIKFNNFAPIRDSYVITLSAGQGYETTQNRQAITLTPSVEKTYNSNPSQQDFANAEIFLGVQENLTMRLKGQLGLSIQGSGNTRITGNIWDDSNPQFNNYEYSYMVQHMDVSLKAKLLADVHMVFIPWLSASMGIGFNSAHAFYSVPTDLTALPTPNFSANSTVAFSYTLGFGLQYPITPHWQIGGGYEFADWGKSELGTTSGQTGGTGPVLNHLYSSSILVNLSYLA
jgi:opacity protein-like surface antigen